MASIKVPDLILDSPFPSTCHLASWYLSLLPDLEYLESPSFPTASWPCFAFCPSLFFSLGLSFLPRHALLSRRDQIIRFPSFRESNGHNRLAVTSREKEGRFYCYFPFLDGGPDGHFTSHWYDRSVIVRFWQHTRQRKSPKLYLRQRESEITWDKRWLVINAKIMPQALLATQFGF